MCQGCSYLPFQSGVQGHRGTRCPHYSPGHCSSSCLLAVAATGMAPAGCGPAGRHQSQACSTQLPTRAWLHGWRGWTELMLSFAMQATCRQGMGGHVCIRQEQSWVFLWPAGCTGKDVKQKHCLQDDVMLDSAAPQQATHWAGGAALPWKEAACSGLRCSLCSALPGP